MLSTQLLITNEYIGDGIYSEETSIFQVFFLQAAHV